MYVYLYIIIYVCRPYMYRYHVCKQIKYIDMAADWWLCDLIKLARRDGAARRGGATVASEIQNIASFLKSDF